MRKEPHAVIAEKKLGISGDYQFKALNNSIYIQSNWHSNKLVVLEDFFRFRGDEQILDLGAGSGNLELLFAKKVKKIVAVDYHLDAVNFLKKQLGVNKIKNVRVKCMDLRDIAKLENGKFNLIFLVDVIEHLTFEDARKLIHNLYALLEKGGQVCIVTPNYNSLWSIIEPSMDLLNLAPHLRGEQHLYQFNSLKIKELFNSKGFKQICIKSFNLFSFVLPTKALSSFFCRIELEIPRLPGNLLFVVFRK